MQWLVAIVLLVISYLIQTLFAPRPQDQKPATLDDFDFPQIEEGTPQHIVFGETWTEDWFILGVGNYRNRGIPAQSSGGKGGK